MKPLNSFYAGAGAFAVFCSFMGFLKIATVTPAQLFVAGIVLLAIALIRR